MLHRPRIGTSVTPDGLRVTADLPCDLDLAWQLLTTPDRIARWWGGHVAFEPKLGGKIREDWTDGDRAVVTTGEVTLWEPPSRLEYHWADDVWPGRTRVSFHLVKARTGTRLVLEEKGWEALPGRTRPELIQAHAEQWSYYMGRLVALAR